MAPRLPALADLRRSLLGAWLACAYGLAVLAAALAPAKAHGVIDGAVLCSGLTLSGEAQPDGREDGDHCKLCTFSPPLAGTGPIATFAFEPPPVRGVAIPAVTVPASGAPFPGLPRPRGPPAA